MKKIIAFAFMGALIISMGCTSESSNSTQVKTDENGYAILTDQEIEDIVKRSYQYVTMYNVNQKMAFA